MTQTLAAHNRRWPSSPISRSSTCREKRATWSAVNGGPGSMRGPRFMLPTLVALPAPVLGALLAPGLEAHANVGGNLIQLFRSRIEAAQGLPQVVAILA